MKFLKNLTLSSLFLLGSCAIDPPTLLIEERKVEVDPAIMRDCGRLIDTLPKGASFEDTLIVHAEDAKTFAECKELNNSKKRIILEFLLNERQKQTDPEPED
jgi:hypothetical protein